MEFDDIKKEYYEILKELAKQNGRSIEEINEEIEEAIENCKDIESLLKNASEII